MTVTRPLAEVVGANCKRWRNQIGLTQDKFAEFARMVGLRWTASAVGDFEAGRSSPSLATVIAVAVALQIAFGRTASLNSDDEFVGVLLDIDARSAPTLADIVGTEVDWIDVNGVLRPPAEDLFKLFRGGVVHGYGGPTEEEWDGIDEVAERGRQFRADLVAHAGVADKRMARQIGISVSDLMVRSIRLWGRTFSEERDQRAGPDANQQKKGRITREMRAELERGSS
ncbi:helix-turn-helix transcriptional regulator [Mycolicibacterium crocinum]|uniref:Helix-turn-helix transcriptional regulator n=1 Tax=Mycolicibacterium crocinum TaxID=388459 RepID=A0ABY3TRL6_9MYCO|nr:helix-turn-helix transcriptional regulator [Mycolicibacterium crocinum]ULN41597.1 helix-turn-helix transcriptional regulator [Mycolicibacterium crocinum]